MTYDIIKKITVPLLKEKIDMLTSAHATNKDTSPSFLDYTPKRPTLAMGLIYECSHIPLTQIPNEISI